MQTEDLKQSKRFFVIDWLISLKHASANNEKLFLYIFIGILIAIVYILSMLVIKQYIQRRNMYRKLTKPDIHEYEKFTKNLESKSKPSTANLNKTSIKVKSSANNLNTKSPKLEKKANSRPIENYKHKNSRISKSSTNIYTETAGDSNVPMLQQQNNHQPHQSQYERLNNNFNPNFHQSNSFANQSHSNLYDSANNNNFDNFEGFKLITRNGSTKIVNGNNDDISEYEIPIIRYNDRSMMQQYSNN